ncbi:MAG: hypothetical protein PHO65_07585 [Sulfurovum sp.]|nr:hypothetical protein [Sulfurovum sp.]
METKTKYLAYTLLLISIFINLLFTRLTPEFLILKPLTNPQISVIIQYIYSICFLLATALLIWRGIYYWRKQGYQHKFLLELIMGLFLSISTISMSYMTKYLLEQTLQVPSNLKDTNLTYKKEVNDLIAKNAYVIDGRILKYNGTVYRPTAEDHQQRKQTLKIHFSLGVITRRIYIWFELVLISLLLGLLMPIRKKFPKNQESQ